MNYDQSDRRRHWGDEGKGKITDVLAKESDIIVRFQGGSNAGHTIKNDYGKFALHMLPSAYSTATLPASSKRYSPEHP